MGQEVSQMSGIKSLVNTLLAVLFGSLILSQVVLADEVLIARLVVEQGVLEIDKNKYPALMNPQGCQGNRGAIEVPVKFNTRFEQAPVVMLGLTQFDMIDGANHRLTVYTTSVDEAGFTYTFKTWCNTKVWSAKAQWIAIGR
jgi:hypothetical protein